MKKVFVLFILLVLITISSVTTVSAGQTAIVFNQVSKKEKVLLPGLHVLIPFIDNIIYVDMNDRDSLAVIPVQLVDGSNANVSVLIGWKVVDPKVYLKSRHGNSHAFEIELTKKVGKTVKSTALNNSLAVFNAMSELSFTDTDFAPLGIKVNYVKLDKITKASKVLNSNNITESSINIQALPRASRMIESAYYRAEQIKTDTQIKEAQLYQQIKNKDPKFYRYFRLIKVYQNTATSKADVPPLSKLIH